LPVFRYNEALDVVQVVKAFLGGKKSKRQKFKRLRDDIESKRREFFQVQNQLAAVKDGVERFECLKRKKRIEQKIFELKRELQAAEERTKGTRDGQSAPQAVGESATGALPDFVIIGAKKCGTTFLYHLLTQHPHVEGAATKEVHFFDALFDEGIEWYRRCFPTPRWKDGQRTITGEATPLMDKHRAPKRMAKVVPQARLITLLRNPVDRAYSDYQQAARKGRETRRFEAAIEEKTTRLLRKEGKTSEHGNRARGDNERSKYLTKGIYVDQLLRWSQFFDDEQILVLKSEDFFERPVETLKVVLAFLDLPEWEPKASELQASELQERRHEGGYEQEMDPSTRRRLEEFFEPHNRRLYDYLGVDFGW
jgi:hypothetical protein